MLGLVLLLVCAGSLVLLVFVLVQGSQAQAVAVSTWLARYSIFSAAVLIAGFLYFLGVQRGGSPAFRQTRQASLDWIGYYTGPQVPLLFTSDGGNTSLKLPLLVDRESVQLTPSPEAKGIQWQVNANVWSQPVRVNGVCVNVPGKNWLLDGDVILIQQKGTGPRSFLALEITDARRLFAPAYRVRFNQGRIETNGVLTYDLREPVEIWTTMIQTERTLAAMFRTFDRQRKVPHPVSPWNVWRRFDRWRHPLIDDLLRQGVSREQFFARLELFEALAKDALFVREEAEHLDSRTGLLITDAAGWKRTFDGTRKSADRSTYSIFDQPPHYMADIVGDTNIDIGSGGASTRQRFKLPDQWSQDRVVGRVADVAGRNQPRWELPPNPRLPFVIMSSEAGVPMTGYDLDIGMRRQPFYAKAALVDGNAFVVNDGKDQLGKSRGQKSPTVLAGELFRLGAGKSGALMQFSLAGSPLPYAGWWCIAVVGVLAFLVISSLSAPTILNPRVETAWLVVFWTTTAILFVRIVLTYRTAVLPPTDAGGPMRALFAQSLVWSVIALAALPLAMLAARALAKSRLAEGISDWLARSVTSTFDFGAVAGIALLCAWCLFVIGTGAKEEIWRLRVNVITQTVTMIAIALAGAWLLQLRVRYRFLAVAVWLLVPIFLMVAIVGDHGFLINVTAMLVVVVAALVWDRYRRLSRLEWAAILLAIAGLSTLIFLRERLLIGIDADTWAERVVASKESYVYYRVAATPEGRQRLLEKVGDPDDFRFDMYRRNAAHHWQMLLYASEGVSDAKGYGGARMSRAGMSYPTSLSDSMFAVHLLPEHGLFAGWTLLLAYLTIAVALIVAAGGLPDVLQYRSLALLGIGAHFIFSALYMVSTNLGQLVFTGQNIPLLSLSSRSDTAAGLMLLALVTFLCHTDVRASSGSLFGGATGLKGLSAAVFVAALIWSAANVSRMVAVGNDKGLRDSLRFPDAILDVYRSHLPSASPSPALQLHGDKLEPVGSSSVSWVEQRFVDQFNAAPDKYDRSTGFYYLTFTSMGDRDVKINERYFSVASPFRGTRRWDGVIRYGADAFPTINVLGTDLQIHPGGAQQPESVSLSSPYGQQHEYSDRIVLKLTDTGPSLCEIALQGGRARIYPIGTRLPQRVAWDVRVDGRPATSGQELKGGEILRIDGRRQQRRKIEPFSYSLLYLGSYEPLLAATRWRNGEMQRIVRAGTLDSMVSDIASAFDTELARSTNAEALSARLPKAINVTLDMPLQTMLDQQLAAFASQIYPERRPREGMALSVVDAFSGDVLAASSWTDARSAARTTYRNWNLRNHAIGSTIKPLLLSTIAAGYQGSGFDVTQFAVYDRPDCSVPQGSTMIHPHCAVAGVPIEAPPWDCLSGSRELIDTRVFLVESRNYMAATLGMLGMLANPRDWKAFLRPYEPSAVTAAQYAGQKYSLTMLAPGSTAFTGRDAIPVPLPGVASESVLFTTFPRLFTVTVPRALDEDQLKAKLRVDLLDYLPSMSAITVGSNYYADDVVPDRIDLLPHDLQSTRRDLLPFFLGGGREGFWSNLRMSEAAARMATGRKVSVHIEKLPAPRATASMPMPLADAAWRERNLVQPLAMVGMSEAAAGGLRPTAAGLADEIESAVPGEGYRAMFKTGTLDERDTNRYESEMLMFVVGKWRNGFVPGRAVAGYLYMADSKVKKDGQWQRLDVARPLLRRLAQHIEEVAKRRELLARLKQQDRAKAPLPKPSP